MDDDAEVFMAPDGQPAIRVWNVDDERYANDAWHQHYALVGKYTKEWEVRKDIKVLALACDRSIRFTLVEHDYTKDGSGRERWHSTQRGVQTMRQLAHVLLAACDFVEESNPEWARHSVGSNNKSPTQFEVKR